MKTRVLIAAVITGLLLGWLTMPSQGSAPPYTTWLVTFNDGTTTAVIAPRAWPKGSYIDFTNDKNRTIVIYGDVRKVEKETP